MPTVLGGIGSLCCRCRACRACRRLPRLPPAAIGRSDGLCSGAFCSGGLCSNHSARLAQRAHPARPLAAFAGERAHRDHRTELELAPIGGGLAAVLAHRATQV